jgi:RNA polymerase sigma-70 factor (ECF subfamily)
MADADQVLMRRLQAGDDSALEVLVHKYQGLVLSVARRYLGSRSPSVEDVAQQVFIRVYRGRMTYQPRAKVKTWLYSVTVNACLNEIRRMKAEKNRRVASFSAVFGEEGDAEGAAVLADPAGDPPSRVLEREDVSRRVRDAVDGLPEQQRLALVLSRFEGCSYEDVAESMHTTVAAVKSLLTRARQNLRRVLADLVEAEAEPAREGNP